MTVRLLHILACCICTCAIVIASKDAAAVPVIREIISETTFSSHTVVIARITGTKDALQAGYHEVSIKVQVVLCGDEVERGDANDLKITFPWPDVLIRRRVGEEGVFFFENGTGRLCAVLPASGADSNETSKPVGARNVILATLLKQLQNEASSERQRQLILAIAPVARRSNERDLTPFLESSDEWVRRSANAALAWCTHKERYLDTLREELRILADSQPPDLVQRIHDGHETTWSFLGLLNETYWFLGAASSLATLSKRADALRFRETGESGRMMSDERKSPGLQSPRDCTRRRRRRRCRNDCHSSALIILHAWEQAVSRPGLNEISA